MEGPHYIITSVNQLENQSEFWPQENMEEIIMIRLPSKPNHYIQTMILPTCVHFKWITGPCAMCVLVTLRVFGVIRKLQLWFITLCIMLHIALVGDNPWCNNNYTGSSGLFCQYHSGTPRQEDHLWILSLQSPVRSLLLISKLKGSPSPPPLISKELRMQISAKFFPIWNLIIYSLRKGSIHQDIKWYKSSVKWYDISLRSCVWL